MKQVKQNPSGREAGRGPRDSAVPVKVDKGDVQAMVLHLFKRKISRHLFFRFTGEAGARSFLRELMPHITMADAPLTPTPDPWFAVGLTFQGLQALRVKEDLLEKLDLYYRQGPDAARLGDVAGTRSDPGNWWEKEFATEDVHCLIHLYVDSDQAAQAATGQIREMADRSGVKERIPRRNGSLLEARSLGDARLHFGYRDGISRPDIRWDESTPAGPGQVSFRNFLLGYSDEDHHSMPEGGEAAELVRNSTYGVFRWIYQDVAAFNAFLRRQAPRAFPHLEQEDAEELLAAKMLGRWRDGTPLVRSPGRPDPELSRSDDFGYGEQDPDGHKCPFSAHIRIVNPRDQRLDDVVTEVPRVIRRGMPYGPELTGVQDDGIDRGLVGVFLCSSLRFQIYIMIKWMQKNDFSPVHDANRHRQDPLFANRAYEDASRDFTIPRAQDEGGDIEIKDLPDFVHTKGTAFLLYPGKNTLTRLAAASGQRQ